MFAMSSFVLSFDVFIILLAYLKILYKFAIEAVVLKSSSIFSTNFGIMLSAISSLTSYSLTRLSFMYLFISLIEV